MFNAKTKLSLSLSLSIAVSMSPAGGWRRAKLSIICIPIMMQSPSQQKARPPLGTSQNSTTCHNSLVFLPSIPIVQRSCTITVGSRAGAPRSLKIPMADSKAVDIRRPVGISSGAVVGFCGHKYSRLPTGESPWSTQPGPTTSCFAEVCPDYF